LGSSYVYDIKFFDAERILFHTHKHGLTPCVFFYNVDLQCWSSTG